MTTLDDCKKELANLRDDCDKLVKCLQDASQAELLEDFRTGIICADEKTIILSADLFDLLCKVNRDVPPEGLGKKQEIKEEPEEAVETVKVETVVEAKVEAIVEVPVVETKVEPVVETPKTIVELAKVELFKTEIKNETV